MKALLLFNVRYFFAGILLILNSCTTTDESTTDNLDIPLSKEATKPKGPEEEELTEKNATSQQPEQSFPADAVLDWQTFFKSSPSAEERQKLAQQLTSWKDSQKPEELVKKGINELTLGQVKNAEASFRQALRLAPDHQEAHLALAQTYLRLGEIDRSFDYLARLKELVANGSSSPSFIFRYRYALAIAYIARGERSLGHNILSDLISLDKTFEPAYIAIASSYIKANQLEVADFIIKQGIDRTKGGPAFDNLLGVMAQKNFRLAEARSYFDKALKKDPNYIPALVNRGALNLQQFEYVPAEGDLSKAILLDSNQAEALVALGICQRRTGRVKAAVSTLNKAIDVAPLNAAARFNLALIYAEDLMEKGEALRLFNEVLQIPEEQEEIHKISRHYVAVLGG